MGSMLRIITITEVERHLLHALSTGASNKHMARSLGKSLFTVRNQLSNLFKRINVSNRTQAVCWYRENGPFAAAQAQQSMGNDSNPQTEQQQCN